MFISKPSIISPFGAADELFYALVKGERKFKERELFGKNLLVGEIAFELPEFSKNTDEIYKTRTNQILLAAILELKEQIDLAIKRYTNERVGVVIGTTTTGVQENFKAFLQDINTAQILDTKQLDKASATVKFNPAKFKIDRNALCNPAEFAREFLGLKNVALGVSTACTSGIKAFESAMNLINLGVCDAVIVGGVDSLNSLTLLGFDSLSVLSSRPCAPFDAMREGINIGEGAGLFVLFRDENSPFCIKSIASNADAFHITQPDPDAKMQTALIQELLDAANLREVDFVSLHATGTMANDAMEACAISESLQNAPCSGIKANIGHTLGAAGAIEAGVCVLAMQNEILPMQILQNFDPSLKPINLVRQSVQKKIKNCLNLSFAFGGDNAGMIVGLHE